MGPEVEKEKRRNCELLIMCLCPLELKKIWQNQMILIILNHNSEFFGSRFVSFSYP